MAPSSFRFSSTATSWTTSHQTKCSIAFEKISEYWWNSSKMLMSAIPAVRISCARYTSEECLFAGPDFLAKFLAYAMIELAWRKKLILVCPTRFVRGNVFCGWLRNSEIITGNWRIYHRSLHSLPDEVFCSVEKEFWSTGTFAILLGICLPVLWFQVSKETETRWFLTIPVILFHRCF